LASFNKPKACPLFSCFGVQLGQVSAKWFTDFQHWLLKDTGLPENSAASYAAGIRLALKKAARERVIPYNPADGVKAISVPEADSVILSADEIRLLAKTPLGGGLGADVKRAFLFARGITAWSFRQQISFFSPCRVIPGSHTAPGNIKGEPCRGCSRRFPSRREKFFLPFLSVRVKI
jgi:hypothetical protein